MARVQLNNLRELHAIPEASPRSGQSYRHLRTLRTWHSYAWRAIGAPATRGERDYYRRTQSPFSAVLWLLAALCLLFAMRASEQLWATANGYPEGARIGSLMGRDRPGNDLTVALRDHMRLVRGG